MTTSCAVCGKPDTANNKLLKCGRCASRLYCGVECQKQDWPSHRSSCRRQNYILKIDLLPRFITNPRVTRTLSCPAAATFAELHEALLVAFGWANTHLYDFDVFNHNDVRGRENRLAGGEPMFKITNLDGDDDAPSFIPMPPKRDSSKVKLFDVLDHPRTKGKTIHYVYDFGDRWEHVVICTGRATPTMHFVCIEGEGHGVAEDVGGHAGWERLLNAYDAENRTENQKELVEWFETEASNKDPKGLRGGKKWEWDKDGINTILSAHASGAEATTRPSSSAISVLLISLNKQPFFDEMYSSVLAKLRAKARVIEVAQATSALQHLRRPQEEYAAVIVTHATVMENKFSRLQNKLVDYARQGGTVILGFLFSSFCAPPKLDRFFEEKWGLDWKSGDYHREMFSLNPQANPIFMSRRSPSLPQQYSMKAVHLSGTNLEDRIYVDPPSSQSPAIFANYGQGHLGWIGDVNTEIGTTELLLTMCGI